MTSFYEECILALGINATVLSDDETADILNFSEYVPENKVGVGSTGVRLDIQKK